MLWSSVSSLFKASPKLTFFCASEIRVARAWSQAERETALRHFKLLRQHAKMKDAFIAIGSGGSTGKYPAVWNFFGRKVTDSRNIHVSRQGEEIDLVAGVARSLCDRF